MVITIKSVDNGVYLETVYGNCKYGQFYSDLTLVEAEQRFTTYVKQIHQGNIAYVMSADYKG